MAVAIGTAFTAVVTQFGNSFIKPLVAVFAGGGAAGGTFVVQRAAVRLRRVHQRTDLLPDHRGGDLLLRRRAVQRVRGAAEAGPGPGRPAASAGRRRAAHRDPRPAPRASRVARSDPGRPFGSAAVVRGHLAPQALVVVRLGRLAPADVPLVVGDGRAGPGRCSAGGGRSGDGWPAPARAVARRAGRDGGGRLRAGHLVTALCQDDRRVAPPRRCDARREDGEWASSTRRRSCRAGPSTRPLRTRHRVDKAGRATSQRSPRTEAGQRSRLRRSAAAKHRTGPDAAPPPAAGRRTPPPPRSGDDAGAAGDRRGHPTADDGRRPGRRSDALSPATPATRPAHGRSDRWSRRR